MAEMKSITAVCVYGKDGGVDRAFERLMTMFTSNHSESYYYGAVIDLKDSLSYRATGDGECEERARKCIEQLTKCFGKRFFCAIRQRRYVCSAGTYGYRCEEGAIGALKGLWRYLDGRKNELFPVYGCDPKGVERIYFSSLDEETGEAQTRENGFECIEPGGIFRLAEQISFGKAVFPISEHTAHVRSRGKKEINGTCEALYSAEALDRLLGVGATLESISGEVSSSVKMTACPSLGENFLKQSSGALLL